MPQRRHRYEFNNAYRNLFLKSGFTISGSSPDGRLVEIIELLEHPFFIATQFHPEFRSRPSNAHPLFLGFAQACLNRVSINLVPDEEFEINGNKTVHSELWNPVESLI